MLRDRNTLYRELDDGRVENVFSDPHHQQGPAGARRSDVAALDLPGATVDSDSPVHFVKAEDVKTVVVRVRDPPEDSEHGGHDFMIESRAVDDPAITATSRARFFAEP